jgi:hypothetical protein
MKLFFISFLASTTCFLAAAQKNPAKFEEVSREELSMKNYSGDTSAAAVILFDKGSAILTMTPIRSLTYMRRIRIKIFRKEAFNEWANKTLFVDRGTFSKLNGITYNLEEDSVVKSELGDKSIFKGRHNKYIDEIKFTLPNVKEGSVIEYSYVIKGDVGVPNWQFQHSIPAVFSEYAVEVPPSLTIKNTVKGLFYPTHQAKNRLEKWGLSNIPAFKSEPLMPNERDYISSINFSFSLATWQSLNSRMWDDENFGGTITGFPFLKTYVYKLTSELSDAEEKMIAICEFIKENLQWNGTEDIYAGKDLADNFKNKTGTAADINLAMASMLHKAGIRVEMVLLSTRGNGFVRMDSPSSRQFDYTVCLAYIDSTEYLLDATEKYLPWNVLPERCLNGFGLAISEKGYRWVEVTTKAKARTVASADLILNHQAGIEGKLTYTRDGYDAYEMRSNIHKNGEKFYLEGFATKHSWNALKSEFQNLEDIEKPAVEVHELSIQEHGKTVGDFIYIDPFITFKEEENRFKADKRKFPIDFGVRSEKIYVANILLPDGYALDEIPQTKIMSLPENKGKFTYTVTQTGNRLTIVSNIQINQRVFMQDQYPNLREFYDRIVAKHAEQIVLKRK